MPHSWTGVVSSARQRDGAGWEHVSSWKRWRLDGGYSRLSHAYQEFWRHTTSTLLDFILPCWLTTIYGLIGLALDWQHMA